MVTGDMNSKTVKDYGMSVETPKFGVSTVSTQRTFDSPGNPFSGCPGTNLLSQVIFDDSGIYLSEPSKNRTLLFILIGVIIQKVG